MVRVTARRPMPRRSRWRAGHTSLMHGWVPITVQVVTGIVLTLAVGWRSPRWRMVWLPLAALVGGSCGLRRALVPRRPRSVRRTGAVGVVAVDRDDRTGRGGADPRLAQRAPLAAGRDAGSHTAVPAQRGVGAQLVDRLLPHGADRVEPTHLGSAARSDRPGHRYSHGRQGNPAAARQRGTGRRSPRTHRISSTAANWCTCRRNGSPAAHRRRCRP